MSETQKFQTTGGGLIGPDDSKVFCDRCHAWVIPPHGHEPLELKDEA